MLKGHIFLLRLEAVLRPVQLIKIQDAEFEQKSAPHMPSGSHIVLISTSQCAHQTITPPYLLYTASKGAIEQMARVMSKELLTKGICVNAVAPGPTGTDMFYMGKTEQMLKGTSWDSRGNCRGDFLVEWSTEWMGKRTSSEGEWRVGVRESGLNKVVMATMAPHKIGIRAVVAVNHFFCNNFSNPVS